MKLVDCVVKRFQVARTFKKNTEKINSIDFATNGETLITSSDDQSIVLYDCEKGVHGQTRLSKKYGADLIRYVQGSKAVIHCSTRIDDTIRYLSLIDNKYIRYFHGHTDKVVSLSVSPVDSIFMSCSLDKTMKLWDLRTPRCLGTVKVPGNRPVANFDPDGLIFALGVESEEIKLYDLASYGKGPFSAFKYPKSKDSDWTGLKFSPDGDTLLISTNGEINSLVHAYNGDLIHIFSGHKNNKDFPLEASFSPDSQFVFSGSADGKVHVWNAVTGLSTAILDSYHHGPVHCVRFSTKYMMLASASKDVEFWLPNCGKFD